MHVEIYIRHLLDDRGRKGSSVVTSLIPVRGFFKFAMIDGLIDKDPAANARLPKVRYERKRPFESGELQKFLAAGKRISPRHWALSQLLGVMALRVSEACSLDVTSYSSIEHGYPILRFVGKNSKPAAMPVPYPVMQALDAARGNRVDGPLLTTLDGRRLTRAAATGVVETIRKHSGLERHINPHLLRAAAITQAFDSNLSTRDVQELARHEDPRTTARYDLGRVTYERHAVHTLAARLAV